MSSVDWSPALTVLLAIGRPYSSTSISTGTRIVRPSAVVSVRQLRTTRRSPLNAEALAPAKPSPAPTTAPAALPATAPAAVPTAVPMAGPGWRVFTTRPSRFVAQPPAAKAAVESVKTKAREVFFIGISGRDPQPARAFPVVQPPNHPARPYWTQARISESTAAEATVLPTTACAAKASSPPISPAIV